MPLPFELTAKNVVKYAKENGIVLTQGAVAHEFPRMCARAVLAHAIDKNQDEDGEYKSMYAYSEDYAKAWNIEDEDMEDIESGFEKSDYGKSNPEYYQLGMDIYLLSR